MEKVRIFFCALFFSFNFLFFTTTALAETAQTYDGFSDAEALAQARPYFSDICKKAYNKQSSNNDSLILTFCITNYFLVTTANCDNLDNTDDCDKNLSTTWRLVNVFNYYYNQSEDKNKTRDYFNYQLNFSDLFPYGMYAQCISQLPDTKCIIDKIISSKAHIYVESEYIKKLSIRAKKPKHIGEQVCDFSGNTLGFVERIVGAKIQVREHRQQEGTVGWMGSYTPGREYDQLVWITSNEAAPCD